MNHHFSINTRSTVNRERESEMVGPAYDFLGNPVGAVRSTFEMAIASGSDPTAFDGKDWGALDLFTHFLFDQAAVSQVPILSPSSISWVQPNTLVRFHGMIQDMLGNEFYVGAFKDGSVWRTNNFTDVSRFPPIGPSPDIRVWERRLLYCVPVPGRNFWTEFSNEVAMNRCMDWASQHREKRQRMDDEAVDQMDMREHGHPSQSSQSPDSKFEGISSCMSVMTDFDRDSLPCLVKIYDSPESDLKLNDVFEFIGILTFDSEIIVEKEGCDEFCNGFSDDILFHMPSNKVPRLHCIFHRKLAVNDFLRSPLVEPKPHLVREMREALLGHLTAVLGNDEVVAQFMLLHLLSRVHARVDNVAVGNLSLNLTCLTKESVSVFGTRLNLAVKNLLPFTHSIPLTLKYLNSTSLAPKKDYQINRLTPGLLQLAEGSHLIIDETQLESGTLNSFGVENVRLLKNLMEFQKVEYDFQYYKMEMAADVQLLILSEGKSHILPADLVIPFQPSSADSCVVVNIETLDAWRWYLATVRLLPHSIKSEMQKVVENDMVAARQLDRSLGSQDFSRWLTMGRLISASFGETSLTMEHWHMVNELERLRRERL
ncbi:LOW QUALITY PROTEIN: MCM_bind domain-containing protein/Racemase_4 domain-containing protein, partial [Cephalotus follicularis]